MKKSTITTISPVQTATNLLSQVFGSCVSPRTRRPQDGSRALLRKKHAFLLMLLACSALSLSTIAQTGLDIALSGTNVQLHWVAASNYVVEATTNLPAGNSWSQATDFIPVQVADAEFTLTYPVDTSARCFRLRQATSTDFDVMAILLETTSAIVLTESNASACFSVANVGGTNSVLDYTVTSRASWLTASTGGSMAAGETNSICVTAYGTDLFAGATYYATLTISDSTGHTLRTIYVSFIIPPALLIVQYINVSASGGGQGGDTDQLYTNNPAGGWKFSVSKTTNSNFTLGLAVNIYGQDDTAYPSSGNGSGSASASQSSATALSVSCAGGGSASVGALHGDCDGIEEIEQGGGSFAFSFGVTHKTHFRVTGGAQEETARSDSGGAGVSWGVGPGVVSFGDQTPSAGTFLINYNYNNGVLVGGNAVYSFNGSVTAGGSMLRSCINSDPNNEYFRTALPGQASLSLELRLY
jgi:hypothetical protein